jgi:hypothetical protein
VTVVPKLPEKHFVDADSVRPANDLPGIVTAEAVSKEEAQFANTTTTPTANSDNEDDDDVVVTTRDDVNVDEDASDAAAAAAAAAGEEGSSALTTGCENCKVAKAIVDATATAGADAALAGAGAPVKDDTDDDEEEEEVAAVDSPLATLSTTDALKAAATQAATQAVQVQRKRDADGVGAKADELASKVR